MTYSLWSRGRLLGTSDLDYVRCMERQRTGDLYPTEQGEALLPIACGVRPAVRAHGDYHHPEVVAAIVRCDDLDLELRGPDGEVIPTEDLFVQDTEYLMSLVPDPEWTDELEPSWEDDLDPSDFTPDDTELLDAPEFDLEAELAESDGEEQRVWPRYQLMVTLVNETDVP